LGEQKKNASKLSLYRVHSFCTPSSSLSLSKDDQSSSIRVSPSTPVSAFCWMLDAGNLYAYGMHARVEVMKQFKVTVVEVG
jgi:hypothetical protein